jgi:uncharacterized protein DUF2800
MEEGREDPGSAYADEGTAAHMIYNLCMVHGHDADYFTGRVVAVGYHPEADWDGALFKEQIPLEFEVRNIFTITDEMASLIDTAVINTRLLLEGSTASWFEVAVPIGHVTLEPGATGTSDVVSVFEEEGMLDVEDLKFGRREVLPNCRQTKLYALGAVEKLDAVYGPFRKIRLVIHQPKIHDEPLVEIITAEELEAFRKEIEANAASSAHAYEFRANWMGKEFSLLVPSEDGCRYCKASGDCPGQDKAVQAAIGMDFDDLTQEGSVTPGGLTPQGMSTPGLAEKLKVLPLVEDWVAAVKAQGYGRALAGDLPPGFKLVLGKKGNRAWEDEAEAEATLKVMRLKQEEMYSFKLKSPTAIEKIFGPKGSAPSTKRWNKLCAMVVQADGKPSLVPVSDTRPEYVVKKTTPDDFDNLTAEDLV